MVISIPFCARELPAVQRMLDWIVELDSFNPHDLHLFGSTVAIEDLRALRDKANGHFLSVSIHMVKVPIEGKWPESPNFVFEAVARHFSMNGKPWFWLEPDALPLVPGWASTLEMEYQKARKPFLGGLSTTPFKHMTGIAIYPAALPRINQRMVRSGKVPFDNQGGDAVLRQAHITDLIQHVWGDVASNIAPTFPDESSLSLVSPKAVIFHRCKDGSLLKVLRARRTPPVALPVVPSLSIPTEADYVSLRRAGDIINVLPLLKRLSDRKGRKIRLVVHKDFMPILEGLSYVEGVPWEGEWEDPLTPAGKFNAVNLQVFGKGLSANTKRDNFCKLAWRKAGKSWDRHFPLVMDNRSPKRERQLWEAVTMREGNRKILVKTHGHSSPFPDGDWVKQQLHDAFKDTAEIVDLDKVQAERLQDLIGLMDRATCMVSTDTVTLHLAQASRCPVVAFTQGTHWGSTPPRGNCLLRVPYQKVRAQWEQIIKTIGTTFTTPTKRKGYMVFSDYMPAKEEDRYRIVTAMSTWSRLGMEYLPFTPKSDRNAQKIGDKRDLPFVRDMIDSVFEKGDACVILNNDISVDKDISFSILKSLAEVGCWWAYRLDKPCGTTDEGADLFAFTRSWWTMHQHQFPDFLLGAPWWDDIMVRIMRWSGCPERERLYYHQPHPPALALFKDTPAMKFNNRLAEAWLREYHERHEKPFSGSDKDWQ